MATPKVPADLVKDIVEQLRREQTLNHTRFMDYMKAERDYNRHMIEHQNKYNEAQLALLGEHLKECARLFELALNPPIRPEQPLDQIAEQVFANPRMSEDEEDLRHAYRMGDIDEVEFQRRLDLEFKDAYPE